MGNTDSPHGNKIWEVIKREKMSDFDVIFDGSRQNLHEVPSKILQMYNLRMLYLEGNAIRFLPDDFFPKLHQLTWLDVRNNRLEAIPETIAYHQHLENLLLSNNKIETLPNELGLVPSLKVVQISDNPIVYPTKKIIAKGTKAICNYLKSEYKKCSPEKELYSEEAQNDDDNIEEIEEIPVKHSAGTSIFITSLSRKEGQDQVLHKMTRQSSKIALKSSYHNNESNTALMSDYSALQKAVVRDNWVKKLKALLAEQERILQQERNLQALTTWRSEKKSEPLRQIQYNVLDATPYDTDPECSSVLSREDLSKQIDRLIAKTRPPPKKTNIEKLINELISELKIAENVYVGARSSRTEIEEAGKQIKMILGIHGKLQRLQTDNDSTL